MPTSTLQFYEDSPYQGMLDFLAGTIYEFHTANEDAAYIFQGLSAAGGLEDRRGWIQVDIASADWDTPIPAGATVTAVRLVGTWTNTGGPRIDIFADHRDPLAYSGNPLQLYSDIGGMSITATINAPTGTLNTSLNASGIAAIQAAVTAQDIAGIFCKLRAEAADNSQAYLELPNTLEVDWTSTGRHVKRSDS